MNDEEWGKHSLRVSALQCDCTLWDGQRCSRSARYLIDSINLCHIHAGSIAIQKLLNNNMAEKIEVTNKYAKDPLCDLKTIYDR